MKLFTFIICFSFLLHCYPKNIQQSTSVITSTEDITGKDQPLDTVTLTADNSPSEIVRLTLDRQCGSCHNSNNSTAKSGALDIFDCEPANWNDHKLADHVPGLEVRTINDEKISEEEKAAIRTFITTLL